jgi:Transposase DDE domain
MYIERVPNRNSPPAILLRESFREGHTVRKRTLANLSTWPPELVEGFQTLLRGGTAVEQLHDAFDIVRSRPHGHVAAVLGTLSHLGLERLIAPDSSLQRHLVVAMIVARLLAPRSKLAPARGLNAETLAHTLGEALGLQAATADDLYHAMDWLLERQGRIEKQLAARHLADGALVLCDVTSTYFEGRTCPLAHLGHSRDDKRGTLQMVFGLLCNREGCPVAVEVFDGKTADPMTLAPQIDKLRQRFGLSRVVLVGDRGLRTEARMRDELQPVAGLDWITALRSAAIQHLVSTGALQLSLFDQRDLAQMTSPDYPGERLVVCKNPLLAAERARKREDLLHATARELEKIVTATQRPKRRLQGQDQIGLRVGRVLQRFKVAKHFLVTMTDAEFTYRRDVNRIAQEAALDGVYVIRTSVAETDLAPEETVRAYKALSRVERAFRSYKTVDLRVRPISHYLADRVRAHVLLCMLAYYVEWHMRQALAPMLFDDADKAAAEAQRASVVAPAQPSAQARRKASRQRTDAGEPVHSFQTLLADLATIVKNRIAPKIAGAQPFDQVTRPTPLQQKVLDLLRVRL